LNESTYLKDQVRAYKDLHGPFSKLIQKDNIYMPRENCRFLKESNIRHTDKAMGRDTKKTNLARANESMDLKQ
jgi:hypothetical protein